MKSEVADMMVLANNVVRGKPLTREQLGIWLDRKCPSGSWRDFHEPELELLPTSETRRHLHLLETGTTLDERPWEEFELQRVEPERDVLMEAGHA